MTSFIETQFPVSKISKESYRERKAGGGQTLTSLGKWWGRKPLILVRAALIGLLMPSSDNPRKDREIFLKILTMDEEGLWFRKKSNIPINSTEEISKYKTSISLEQKKDIQKLIFSRLTYDEKLQYCYRPEQVEITNPETWQEINAHLGTHAKGIQDLVQELGKRQFGHIPRVGDCFCGGGSVPFEAARIGCGAFASDLNPVAALLTWASLNIIGGGEEVIERIKASQQEVYDAVNKHVIEWGIEQNEQGWRADAYLYCIEVICPECGWRVPLAPSWVIGKKTKTIAMIIPDQENHRFDIEIKSKVTAEAMEKAENGTVKNSRLVCPNNNCTAHNAPVPIGSLRGEGRGGLRLWENHDIVPRPDDVIQERLYCIRWVETYNNEKGIEKKRTHYHSIDVQDLEREKRVLALIRERFAEWQLKGYIPSKKIEAGTKTNEPIRTRGWTHWHHLFNPRQLLLLGLFMQYSHELYEKNHDAASFIENLLEVGKLADRKGLGCKLLIWNPHSSKEGHANVFLNQALNTLFNYCHRTFTEIEVSSEKSVKISADVTVQPIDARSINDSCDFWITDPPYADAINYHELSEFFLAWYDKNLKNIFPNWYTDSKRALAIQGSGEEFRRGMVETYRNLANHMPDNGIQIVMFTHQDAGVWADLALILWASGLRVTAAWCIATETDSSLKIGNYVQGTVLLVLRKQNSNETAFLDEIYPRVEIAVKEQLDRMLALEDKEDPNFGDTDYQLAAYAAALQVLTNYKMIEDIDVKRELSKVRQKNEKNPLELVIENAVKIACDYLVPTGIQTHTWKQLAPEERFYLKGLEIESHGEHRNGAYQELARGFGIREYKNMEASEKANQTRLMTATEFKNKNLDDKEGFGSSLLRNLLFAVNETVKNDETSAGKIWLRTELGQQYWNKRREIIELLRYLSGIGMSSSMAHWKKDADAARLLAGAVENDHI